MEKTFACYQKHMPLDADTWDEIQAHKATLDGKLLPLDFGEQILANNNTHVIAQGRGEALISAYKRRFALMEEKARLTEEINESLWPQLAKRLRRWWIGRQLIGNTSDEDLSAIKDSVTSRMKAFPMLMLEGMTYDEMLEVIDSYLASDERSSLYEGRARELKKKIKQVIAIEAELGATPSLETLKMFGNEIVSDLQREPRLLSVKTAKAAHRRFRQQLKWGRSGDSLLNISSLLEGLTRLWSSKGVWNQAGFDRDEVVQQILKGGDVFELTGADKLGPFRAAEIEKEAKEAGHNKWALHRLLYQVAREKAWTQKPLTNLKV